MTATKLEDILTTRKRIRHKRKLLNQRQQYAAQHSLLKSAKQCRPLWFAQHVLSYEPFEGEISPHSISKQFARSELYLPKINNYRNRSMQIFKAEPVGTFNRFGILEPRSVGTPATANQMSAILLPLVGFDRNGNRVGMGAGYYDRALESLAHQTGTRPLLIGLAHWFQEVTAINSQSWDVPLDAILTDREYIPVATKLLRPSG